MPRPGPAVLLLLALAVLSARGEALPSAAELVPRVLARDAVTTVALKKYRYHQTVHTTWLNPDGTIRHGEEMAMVVRPGDGDDFSIVGDGGDSRGVLLAPTSRQRRKVRESEKLKASFSLRRLAPRFDLRVTAREVYRGRAAYVLEFTPKGGLTSSGGPIGKVLDHLSGRMWIGADDATILKTEATLSRPLSLAWVFATMEGLDFTYHSRRLSGGDTVPDDFTIDYRVSVITHQIHQRQEIAMDDYRADAR